jgi:ferredoxin-NADP reductase
VDRYEGRYLFKSLAFLAQHQDKYPFDALVDATFTLDWIHTRQAPAGAGRRPGRIDAATIAELALPPGVDPLVYVCGPTGFVEAVASFLVQRGHRPDRIRTERFGGL